MIDHGDADVDLLWRNAIEGVSEDNRLPDLGVRTANRKVLGAIMPEHEWRQMERNALSS